MTATPAPRDEGHGGNPMPGGYPLTVPVDREPRTGDLTRVTTSRTAYVRCLDCNRTFTTTGTGASHARAARHAVFVEYRTAFTYAPNERLAVIEGGAS